MKKPRIVIIGGGFGGLTVAKSLLKIDAEITIIDKTNYHLFQPLLYQVASAALSPADIAIPIRAVFGNRKNVKVIMDEVISINSDKRQVILKDNKINFDYLIIAIGSSHSYFGNENWEQYAPGLKTLGDALEIREKILKSLEFAEKEENSEKRKKYLRFVIVGGGPTGVEMAGAISEIAKQSMMKDFRNINSSDTEIFLIEGTSRILNSYSEKLSQKAQLELESMGVVVKLNTFVTDISAKGVKMGENFIETTNVIWAAGNQVSPILKSLNVELDKVGRVMVNRDLSIENDPNIFVIGDAAHINGEQGKPVPGVAQGAIQEGKFVAEVIKSQKRYSERGNFIYKDKGNLATIGRAKAIAEIKGLKLSGFLAWLTWCFIHILYLISFRNRFRVMAEWAWYYLSFRHGIRLIVGKPHNRDDN
ncbi:MAG TPA: NAD(P)/FAD-dependent oxidoreductase [Ignavibacteriaceae bacterium]|nr:NAD(P)/FAD-dependent oxidoreductase [Ignavibacteriaceae bacterium]